MEKTTTTRKIEIKVLKMDQKTEPAPSWEPTGITLLTGVVGLAKQKLTSSPSMFTSELSLCWRNRSMRHDECSGPAPSNPKHESWREEKATKDGRSWVDIRGSLWNHWHPPSRTKTKDLSINLRFNYFKVFTVEVESFFRPFKSRQEDGKKVNFWKEPQHRPFTIINFPSSQNYHSLRAFSQFWEQGRIASG